MSLNVDAFSLDLDRFARNTNASLDQVARGVASRIFENIVRRTPVGDPTYWKNPAPPGYVGGYARNNWYASLNQTTDANPVNTPEGGGTASFSSIGITIAQAKAGDVFWIQNGVEYIQFLEEGTASPRQAPVGMVKVTIQETITFFNTYAQQELNS